MKGTAVTGIWDETARYYMVLTRSGYILNNDGDITVKALLAARLKPPDYSAMHDAMLRLGISGELIPVGYKPNSQVKFLDPVVWEVRQGE